MDEKTNFLEAEFENSNTLSSKLDNGDLPYHTHTVVHLEGLRLDKDGNALAPTQWVIFEGKLYRQRSQVYDDTTKQMWRCKCKHPTNPSLNCPGTLRTHTTKPGSGFDEADHADWCTAQFTLNDWKRHQMLQKMVRLVRIGSSPKEAYFKIALNNPFDAKEFWDFRAVKGPLTYVRQKQSPKLNIKDKDEIGEIMRGTRFEQNYYGAMDFSGLGSKEEHIEVSQETTWDEKILDRMEQIQKLQEEIAVFEREKMKEDLSDDQLKDLKSKMHFAGENGKFHVFMDKSSLKVLASSKWWLLDGTFKVSPKISRVAVKMVPYGQVFIINAAYIPTDGNDVDKRYTVCTLPCVYVLMPGKPNHDFYEEVFRFIIEKGKELTDSKIDLSKLQFKAMLDFEQAPRIAMKDIWKEQVKLVGCGFHYTQKLMKHLGTFHL